MKKIKTVFKYILLITPLLNCIDSFSQSVANYDITLTTIWNSTDHTSVPSGAHWSALVGATHKNINDIITLNASAPLTDGIKDVAEIGNNTNFNSEVNTTITDGNADQYFEEVFSTGAVSTATLNAVSVSEDFPYITLASMVAPSPDWFIAVVNENLRSGLVENNGWKNTYTIDVFAYDAGTDDGENYSSTNMQSIPRTVISKITDAPIFGNKMGTLTFTYRSSTLSTNSSQIIKNITVFPNPAKDYLTIGNIENIDIKSIEIYNVIGRLIKRISPSKESSNINIDFSSTSSGIYLLKLNTTKGLSRTQKIIIDR